MFVEFIMVWLFAVIIVAGLSWIVIDSRNRREINHIPGPRIYPIIGNLLEFFRIRRGFHEYFQNNRRKYGPIFRLRFLFSNFVIISDTDYVKTLLTSSENLHPPLLFLLFKRWLGEGLSMSTGNKWYNQRKIINPMFTNLKIKMFIPSIVERCEKMCKDLERFDGREIDLFSTAQDVIAKLAYDNVLGIMLDDPDYNDLRSIYAETILERDGHWKLMTGTYYYCKRKQKVLTYLIVGRMLRPWVWNDFIYSLTTNGAREKVLIKTLPNITMQAIFKKKMRNTKEEDEQKNRISFLDFFIEYQKRDSSISDEDIRTQLDTLVAGMMNTTGLALFLTLYFIASNDSLQDNIRKEIAPIFSQPSLSKEAPAVIMDQISRLKYLECIIEESFRLPKFPPVLGRFITEKIHLGNYSIPVGTTVLIDTNAIHHDEKYYSTPDRFNPEHFYNREAVEQRPRYTFLPFGGGLRRCVGEKYTKIIMKLIIAHVVRNFHIESNQSKETLMNSLMMSCLMKPNDNTQRIFIRLSKITPDKQITASRIDCN